MKKARLSWTIRRFHMFHYVSPDRKRRGKHGNIFRMFEEAHIVSVISSHKNFVVASVVFKQSYDYPSIIEITLNDISKIDSFAQGCSNSITNTLELLLFCTKPSKLAHAKPHQNTICKTFTWFLGCTVIIPKNDVWLVIIRCRYIAINFL